MNRFEAAPTDTKKRIIDAAIQTFVRYGTRKAAMSDIASAARLSRQTIYDLFGSKEDLIRACIRAVTDRNLAQVQARLPEHGTLAEQLDIYFAETVAKGFELLQGAGDFEDLIAGHNEAGKDQIARSHARHEELVAGLLAPYAESLRASGLSVGQQAHFIVTVAMGLKYNAKNREDLDALLGALKLSCLSMTGNR
ncbi:TetR/AcrR family transcriptional regulator [Oricola sp.]|uniref:TetR/AcrR family transcriptional regulator n=1 Tax=Oricola sp. TaxID=1979950 RepID=UPI003BACBF20